MKDTLLMAALGGSEKLRNTGLGFPEDISELTFRLPVFFVIAHHLQFLYTNLVPIEVCLQWGGGRGKGWCARETLFQIAKQAPLRVSSAFISINSDTRGDQDILESFLFL